MTFLKLKSFKKGNVLKKEARSIDIPARIGGEEFNLLLPGVNSKGVYIAPDGTATEMTYSVEKSVPSDAVFTDTTYTFTDKNATLA